MPDDSDVAALLACLPIAPARLAAAWRAGVPDIRPPGRAADLENLLRRLFPGFADMAGVLARARREAAGLRVRAARAGIEPITLWQDRYPSALAAIPDPPVVLWVKGRLAVLERPAVAVVGSRTATAYAVEVAERLGTDLVDRGVSVVSGLARGVDAAAHRGALASGGPTVAALGSGLDIIYPPEHAPLAAAVGRAGALVSELAPGTPPRRAHFPSRNRLISGLSLAVVVVEASDRSGSLITARCALDQGRDVMAVPGNVLSGRNRGSHALLKDGAKVVETADDIVEEIGWDRGGVPAAGRAQAGPPLAVMARGDSYSLDDLLALTGLRSEQLLARLLELEVGGAVRRVGGGRFMRCG